MPKSEFYNIVKMDDIQVSIPQTSHFSVGTSPYYAHQHGLAIDIYHNLTLDNYNVVSPVSGKVVKIKSVIAPKPKFHDSIDHDYLILISNPNNPQILWKIMHVQPNIKVGENIEIGNLLGKTIRNGYFAYWSSPHLHLEIRSVRDAIRARGGKNFSLEIEEKNILTQFSKELNEQIIPIEIHSIYPEIILAHLPKHFYHNLFPFYGVKARVNELECILDGGIPHYKIGTVIFKEKYTSDKLYPVYLGPHKIGTLHEKSGQFGFLKFENIAFILNDKEIRGLSLYLANFLPLIKLIPYKKNQFSFKHNSIQYLKLISR